jgi:hypothetical protein
VSFARFSNSDVYIFEHVGGFIQCCGCSIPESKKEEIFGFADLETPRDAIEHLKSHKKAGDDIGDAIKRIKETYKDLDVPIKPYVESSEVKERIKWRLRELNKNNKFGSGSDYVDECFWCGEKYDYKLLEKCPSCMTGVNRA